MLFRSRYLPEYRALRRKAGGFLDFCFTPELAVEATLQPIRRYGFDAAILFSDILVVPHALGQKVWFEEGRGPRLEALSDIAALDRLQGEAVAAELGLEGVVVSNHGGRQFDGAPAAIEALPGVVAELGTRMKVVFDSGMRSGLDIARALALGADFVLLGRAYMFGVAALGERGGDHVTDILLADLSTNMSQLGCARVSELPGRLAPESAAA